MCFQDVVLDHYIAFVILEWEKNHIAMVCKKKYNRLQVWQAMEEVDELIPSDGAEDRKDNTD